MFENIDFAAIAAQYAPPPTATAAPPEAPAEAPPAPPEPQPTFTMDNAVPAGYGDALQNFGNTDYGALPFDTGPAPEAAPDPAPAAAGSPVPRYTIDQPTFAFDEFGGMGMMSIPDPHQETYDAAYAAGLDLAGVDLLHSLGVQGGLDKPGADGRTAGAVVIDGLRSGDLTGETARALLQQVTAPADNVLQVAENSCVAAMVQQTLAMNDPATYLAAGTELLNGRPATVGAATLETSAQNRATVAEWGATGPEQIDMLFQAALMDRGDGAATYDLAADRSTTANGRSVQGLFESQAAELCRDVLGAPMLLGSAVGADFEAASKEPPIIISDPMFGYFEIPGPSREQLVANRLAEARQAGFPGVFVPVSTPEGGRHFVLVGEVVTTTTNAKKAKDRVTTQSISVRDASGKGSTQMDLYAFYGSVATFESDERGIGTDTRSTTTGGTIAARTGRAGTTTRVG